MKRILQKIGAMVLCATLICSMLPARAEAGYEIPGICQVQTDFGAAGTVKILDCDYVGNAYLSLRDIAMVLNGTEKGFSLDIAKASVSLNLGQGYVPVGTENVPWGEEEIPEASVRRNEFTVNGEKTVYYTLILPLPSGSYDCFMMAADVAMILDVNLEVSPAGVLQIYTSEPFQVSPEALEQAGYFYGVNSVLAGDATTGEIYYGYQAEVSYPIASTSKLMTCLLTMEAISAGQLSPGQLVTISEGAQMLAESGDGVIPLKAGEQITVEELLLGALLPSSNECAFCLAETVAGSEEAFVERMNQKALELGLSQAVFYNSHGLPAYTQDAIPSKRQNRMSAEDMFRMVSYLLRVYPQITDITSQKSAVIESLGLEVKNSNPLLHNMAAVTGLKTGTTNKAGACLVTSLRGENGAMEHDLVVVLLGAENSIERGRVAGLLAAYALQTFRTGAEETRDPEAGGAAGQPPLNLPTHGEAAVDWILKTAGKRQRER